LTKRILILAANPKNTERLRLDEEVREIDNALQRAPRREELTLKSALAPRRKDLNRAVLDFKPNVVHFCGHGSGEDGIALEDDNGQIRLVSADTLEVFFEIFAKHVECVVLNACYTEIQAEAIAKHIPYVIGMRGAIGDAAAIEFAVAFYDALGAGEEIEFAYKLACNTIQLPGTQQHLTPILKSKPPQKYFWAPYLGMMATVLGSTEENIITTVVRGVASVASPVAGMRKAPYFVTNLEYLDFVQSSRLSRPRHWSPSKPHFPEGEGDAPVTWVSWDDAAAYCDWKGGRLPGRDDNEPPTGGIPEIGEWRESGDERQKQVCNPYTSRLVEVLDRETARQNVGFRCIPVRCIHPAKSVLINGGRYQLGTDVKAFQPLAQNHSLPASQRRPILMRQVGFYSVPSFGMSATCVTNEEYFKFTKAHGARWPLHWQAKWLPRSSRAFPARLASQPVVNVTAEDAQAYCIWSRTRLPSWLEWERAASGQTRQPYPWGIKYDAARCNSVESGCGSLAAVDECPLGDSPEGVRQLCGNAAEWVMGPEGQFELRGGSFRMPCELWGLVYAFRQPELGYHAPDVGFRVVSNLIQDPSR